MLLNNGLRFLLRRSPSICPASTRHLSSAAAAPRFSISDNALLTLRSRLLTYSSNFEGCWYLGIASFPSVPRFIVCANLSPRPGLVGLQVAFANVFAEVLEHGGPTRRNAQGFIDIPDKDFDE